MALEDEEWNNADIFFERVLDMDAECAEAYLGKMLAHNTLKNIEEIKKYSFEMEGDKFYKKVVKFGSKELIEKLDECKRIIADKKRKQKEQEEENERKRIEQEEEARKLEVYN